MSVKKYNAQNIVTVKVDAISRNNAIPTCRISSLKTTLAGSKLLIDGFNRIATVIL